jgi:exosortase/archaeosortase family protein
MRYIFLVLLALPNFLIFYLVFTSFTIYGSYFLLKIFFPIALSGNLISLDDSFFITIIPACVAGAVYYLLLVLHMSIPNMKPSRRIGLISLAFGSFLIINILRILMLGALYFNEAPSFYFVHKFMWYFGSIVVAPGIWFLEVYLFKIKEIPFYSDLRFLYKRSLFN